ncbi:MAG: cellulase family glycosylhydrolase [Chitinophagaceae bacterium]|nr:cellulase family glycosylhydrolase [Rubrivivax sp.]
MRYGLQQHRFGVNYTPTRAWWDCWNDFDADAIARDLDAVAAIGADHIRIMLMWPYFQPNPSVVSAAHLNRLDRLMRLAAERELDVCVTLFVGWLSGFAFKPAFQKDDNFYDLAASRGPQLLYLEAMAGVVRTHENFLGFDLGNELACCWKTDADTGDGWSAHMLAECQRLAPQAVHVNGTDHQSWFYPSSFSPQHLARGQAIAALHCWPLFTGAIERSGGDAMHACCLSLSAGMAALARAHAGDANKPVWIQEYGMSESWTAAENVPRFLHESTAQALASGVNWFTWWSSHDLDRAYRFDPLEYSLGLIDHDNRIKPAGLAFKAVADAWRGKPVAVAAEPALAPPLVHDDASSWQWLDAWRAARA